jgi:hypothetical protein
MSLHIFGFGYTVLHIAGFLLNTCVGAGCDADALQSHVPAEQP